MALNSRGSVDPRWLTHNRGVVRALQLATVEIYKQGSTTRTYDPVTNTWSGSTTTVFSGRARVQQLNAPTEADSNYNPTFIKTVRVQIDATDIDIRPNDRMLVTSCDTNPQLEKFIFVVTDVLNSSNAWERTLLCRVDTELDPTEV